VNNPFIRSRTGINMALLNEFKFKFFEMFVRATFGSSTNGIVLKSSDFFGGVLELLGGGKILYR
jgi:hypothetical protein